MVGTVFAGFWLYRDLSGGMPGRAFPVLVIGLLSTVAAILAPEAGSGRHRSLGAAATVGVVAAAAGWLVPGTVVRSQTAAAVTAPTVLERPGPGGWVREVSSWTAQVRAAGAGVVYSDRLDQVTAADGRTGAVRWVYGQRGAYLEELRTSTDGRTVVAMFVSGHRENASAELVVLDAFSGRRLWQRRVDGELGSTVYDEGVPYWPAITVAEQLLVIGDGPRDAVVRTFDLRKGPR